VIAAIEAMTGLSTLWARIAATGGLVALVLSAWFAFALHYENKGAAKAVAKIEQRTQANVEKAQAARRSVETLPADRLTDRYRRD
jgi:predicted nucleic acid-binding protein